MSSSICGHHSTAATPRELLMEEHRVIEKVLDAMERMADSGCVDKAFLELAIDFLRNFADGCHHAKEEDVLFPALEKAGIPREGGPIGCMLHEHQQGRHLIGLMAGGLDEADRGDASATSLVIGAASEYIDMLRQHIYKEDNVLFVIAQNVLNAEQQAEVLTRFGQAEGEADPEKHECYIGLADKLSNWKFPHSHATQSPGGSS